MLSDFISEGNRSSNYMLCARHVTKRQHHFEVLTMLTAPKLLLKKTDPSFRECCLKWFR